MGIIKAAKTFILLPVTFYLTLSLTLLMQKAVISFMNNWVNAEWKLGSWEKKKKDAIFSDHSCVYTEDSNKCYCQQCVQWIALKILILLWLNNWEKLRPHCWGGFTSSFSLWIFLLHELTAMKEWIACNSTIEMAPMDKTDYFNQYYNYVVYITTGFFFFNLQLCFANVCYMKMMYVRNLCWYSLAYS